MPDLKTVNVNELIYLYFLKDEEALPLLIEYYRPMVLSLIRKNPSWYKAGRQAANDYIAEMDELMINCLERYRFSEDITFTTFYRQAIKNKLTDLHRFHSRRDLGRMYEIHSLDEQLNEDTVTTYEEVTASPNEELHEKTMAKERLDYLLGKLKASLDKEDYDILMLKLADHTNKEIAEIKNVSVKKVSKSLRLSRLKALEIDSKESL